jgi:hypothetical protein
MCCPPLITTLAVMAVPPLASATHREGVWPDASVPKRQHCAQARRVGSRRSHFFGVLRHLDAGHRPTAQAKMTLEAAWTFCPWRQRRRANTFNIAMSQCAAEGIAHPCRHRHQIRSVTA